MTALTLPREHGAYLMLAGVCLTSARLAPHGGAAFGAVLVIAMAYLARGPVERLDAGLTPRPWDTPALVLMAALAALGASLAFAARPLAALCAVFAAAAMVVAGLVARRGRWLRSASFETAAMGGLGASAGLALWCAGASPSSSIAVAAVLGAHAAASVPLVRARVRRRGSHGRLLLAAAAMVVTGVAIVIAVDRFSAALALTPRAIDVAFPAFCGVKHAHARAIGWRETALLAAVVVILAAAMR